MAGTETKMSILTEGYHQGPDHAYGCHSELSVRLNLSFLNAAFVHRQRTNRCK